MNKLTKNKIQEIIDYEVVVDCYTQEEVNLGWAIYMEDNMNFPFKAEYHIKQKNGKKRWEQVNVVNNLSTENNFDGVHYFVEIEIRDIIVPVNLDDLKNITADKQTLKTLQIWNNK